MKQSKIVKVIFESTKFINKWLWAVVAVGLAVIFTIADAAGCTLNLTEIESWKIGTWVGLLSVPAAVTYALENRNQSKHYAK